MPIDLPNRYVAGLFFSPDLAEVALLYKRGGPEHVRNTWTCVGGHIQLGEGIRAAMRREFLEEASVDVDATRWLGFHSMRFRNGAVCHFLAAQALSVEEFRSVQSSTAEPVRPYLVSSVLSWCARHVVKLPAEAELGGRYNLELSFLIPMAVQRLQAPLWAQNLGY